MALAQNGRQRGERTWRQRDSERLEKAGRWDVETSLRPRTLDEYIGQDKVKEHMGSLLPPPNKGANPLDHVLLYGLPVLARRASPTLLLPKWE